MSKIKALGLWVSVLSVWMSTTPEALAADLKAQIRRSIASQQTLKTLYQSDLFQTPSQAKVQALLELVNDDRERDDIRFASLFGLAHLTGKHSFGILKKYMNHSNWMLRDAALKAAAALNATELAEQIETKLKDEALVIRTTAVDTIGHLGLRDSAPKLLEALNDNRNYNAGKPLWIHGHIFRVLRDFNYTAAMPKLVELLERYPERNFQAGIITTLEQMTGKSFASMPVNQQIYLWKRNTLADKTF